MSDLTELFGEAISVYTRAQAIEDGFIVDAGPIAQEAGFSIPVGLTRAVWDDYVRVPEGVDHQDQVGRLWDILFMAAYQIRRSSGGRSFMEFQVHVRNDNRSGIPPLITLTATITPEGPDGGPVITIMKPGED